MLQSSNFLLSFGYIFHPNTFFIQIKDMGMAYGIEYGHKVLGVRYESHGISHSAFVKLSGVVLCLKLYRITS
jgi:hypothetical protein